MALFLGSILSMAANTAIGAITGGIKAHNARAAMRYYEDKINKFDRQDLSNPYRDITVPTKRIELAQEEMARTTAQMMGSAGLSGARGLASMATKALDSQYKTQNDIAAYYEEQQNRIDQLVAADDVAIRNTQEQRDNMELAGLQRGLESATNQYNVAQDQMWGSVQSGLGGASGLLNNQNQMNEWDRIFNGSSSQGGYRAPVSVVPGLEERMMQESNGILNTTGRPNNQFAAIGNSIIGKY